MKRVSSLSVLTAGGEATEDCFQVRSLPCSCPSSLALSSPLCDGLLDGVSLHVTGAAVRTPAGDAALFKDSRVAFLFLSVTRIGNWAWPSAWP